MFKKKQVQNTAAIPTGIPRPAPAQTVHNHAPSEAGRILAQWFVYLVLAVIGWFFIRYLVSQMGYRNPDEALGWFLFGGIALLIVTWAIDRTFIKYRKMSLDYQVVIEEIRAEAARSKALTAGSPAPTNGRLTGEQKRLYENLALVMQKAYQDLVDSQGVGYQGGGDKRPWSKRAVLAMEPPRHGKMPESQATKIREWLVEHKVIVGDPQNDQINTEAYPAFEDFLALLHEKFNMPVVVHKAFPSSTGDGYLYRF